MDEDGNVFIRGRIKALILSSSGQNIYPEEIEQVVMRNHVVRECLVVARNGKIHAMVYLDPDTANKLVNEDSQNAIAEEIRSRSNAFLPQFSQIFMVELVDAPFERTAKGSIKRHLYQ